MIPNQPEYFAVPSKRNTAQVTHVILLFFIVLIKNKTAEIILIMYHFYPKYFKKCYARHVCKYQWLSCYHTGQQFEVLSMNKDVFLQHKTTIRIRKLTSTAILLLYYYSGLNPQTWVLPCIAKESSLHWLHIAINFHVSSLQSEKIPLNFLFISLTPVRITGH